MIREGQLDATLQYMAENPRKIAVHGLSEGESFVRCFVCYSANDSMHSPTAGP